MIRAVVKSSFIRAGGQSKGRAKAHVRYIAFRPGPEGQIEQRTFFTDNGDGITAKQIQEEIDQLKGRGVLTHKMIVSPGLEGVDTQEYTREVLSEWSKNKGLDLKWRAVVHDNTAHEHAHVVIFGKDAKGRDVRITRQDLKEIRELGDRYLQREHAIELKLDEELREKARQKTKVKRRGSFGRFVEAMNEGAKRFKEALLQKEEEDKKQTRVFLSRREAEQKELAELEAKSLGEKPDQLAIAYRQVAKWRRQCEKEDWELKEKQRPIKIDYGSGKVMTYTQNTPKDELAQLKRQYDDGRLEDKITKRESKRLAGWVRSWDKWEKDTARLDWIAHKEAKTVNAIQLDLSGDEPDLFTLDTDLAKLKGLKRMHDRGAVHIDAAEYKALDAWIKTKERNEPIRLDMGKGAEPLVYRKDDPKESLELLAKVGKEALDDKEYKKLWGWIYEKEREELDRPIKVKTKTADLVYTRHDEKEQLEHLAKSWNEGNELVRKQVTEKDFQKLQRWLKEKEGRGR